MKRWTAGATALVVAMGAVLALDVPRSSAAGGSLLLNETFQGATVPDPGFVPLNDACLTGASGAPPAGESSLGPCTSHQTGPVPPAGVTPGYLQLTDSQRGATGGVLYNRPLPANGGLEVTFKQYQYGGTGADGIAFFLVDGAAELTMTGSYGGGLGYAQRSGQDGVAHGYLGVGLDAYGNYAVDFEGRGTGCPADQKPPSVYQVYDRPPNSVTLRGPGDGTDGYCYLAGTGTTTQIGTDPDGNKLYGSTLPGRLHDSTLAGAERTVRVTVSADKRPTVKVEIDFGSGFQQVLSRAMPQDAPRTYKFGFAASTGSDTDVHLIRNVEVRSEVPLRRLNLVKQVDKSTPQPDRYQVGDTVPYEFVVTNTGSQPLNDVTVTDPKVTGIRCPRRTLAPRGERDATMKCTADHVLTTSDIVNGRFTNTATAAGKDPGGTKVDADPSTVSVPVTGGVLKLAKKVSPATARPGQTVTYTIVAENAGDQELTNARFTDELRGVLDDADYQDDAQADPGTVTYTAPTLTWTGDLAPGAKATVIYSVKVKSGGDGKLRNSVASRDSSNCPPSGARAPECRTTVTVTVPQGRLTLAKKASTRRAKVGGKVIYTITARNTGNGALPEAAFVDDLAEDLDDARYMADAKATSGRLTYSKPKLTWRGSLDPGETVTVTYSVKVRRGGDGELRNAVVSRVPQTNCPPHGHKGACHTRVKVVPVREKPILR